MSLFADPEICQAVLLDHYRHPRNRGTCAHATGSAAGENPACGDQVRLSWEVVDGRLACVRFDGAGCAASQASASLVAARLEGMPLVAAVDLARSLLEWLADPAATVPAGVPFGDLEALGAFRNHPARVQCLSIGPRLVSGVLAAAIS